MTLAVAIRCSDGLVMATDSRASGGPRGAADSSEKFLQVNRDVGIMTFGLAVPGYRAMRQLVEDVRSDPGRFATMAAVSEQARLRFQEAREQFIDEAADGAKEAVREAALGFIVGGFDGNDSGQFRVFFAQQSDGFVVNEHPSIIAAQWHLAESLTKYFSFPGMSVSVGVNLAVILIVLTATVEDTVGGPIRLATVDLERGFTLLHEKDIQSLIATNQRRLSAIRRAWTDCWDLDVTSA